MINVLEEMVQIIDFAQQILESFFQFSTFEITQGKQSFKRLLV